MFMFAHGASRLVLAICLSVCLLGKGDAFLFPSSALTPFLCRTTSISGIDPIRLHMLGSSQCRSIEEAPWSTIVLSRKRKVGRLHAYADEEAAARNEYESFFQDACRCGSGAIRSLTAEERADKALEGERIEDLIISTAIKLRGQQMKGEGNSAEALDLADSIAQLKEEYRTVVGAVPSVDEDDSSMDGELTARIYGK
ncbi:unnamed protein product [Choristocarpus tenellus]